MNRKIIQIETQYFSVVKVLSLIIGLWPYRRSKFVRFQSIVVAVTLSTFIIFQFATFLTLDRTPELIIRVCSFTSLFIGIEVAHYMYWFKGETMKYLLEQLQHICNELKDEHEITIIEKYGKNGKRFAVGLVITAASFLSVILCAQICPLIINNMVSVNETQLRRLPVMAEYFLDREKYFYLIMLHMNLAVCMGTIAAMSVGLIMKAYLQFMCGIFRIASHRIEQASLYNVVQNINKVENITYKQIICAVDIHCKAMKFSQYFMSSFEGYFFFLMTSFVVCLSFNLFCVFQLISTERDIDQLSVHLGTIAICFICMFFGNYTGQEIIDCNNQVFDTAYNIQWYKAPLYVQKLIFFLLQRSNKAFILNIAGFYLVCLENFATMTSAAISYCTVMSSMQR